MTRLIPNPFFDHSYTVVPDTNIPNLFRHEAVKFPRGNAFALPHAEVVNLITALTKKRPEWVFLMTTYESKTLNIYTKDKEHLGSVAYYPPSVYSASRAYFQLANFRIEQEAKTSAAGRCHSVDKAVARIVAKFRPMNLEELARQRAKSALDATHEMVARGRSSWIGRAPSSHMTQIRDYVLGNPERFVGTPIAPLIDNLRPIWLALMETQPYTSVGAFEIVTEIEQDGVRQLYNITAAPNAYWLDQEEHRDIISKVSMLRMVDVGQVVPGIGFRSEDHTFVVLR